MPRPRRFAMVLATLPIVACGSSSDRVVVFAASSLTDAFDRIETEFEAAHPGTDVVISYGGSSTIVSQVVAGAPADVLATADHHQMDRAVAASDDAGTPELFAVNEMTIAVARGNPLGVVGLGSLPSVPVVVLAAPEVPAGAYATQILECAGVELAPASLEPSVRSVATKIALGEADAGLVYRTDIGVDLVAVEIEDGCNVHAEYPIVALGTDPAARTFVEFVLGPAGRAALADAGFEQP